MRLKWGQKRIPWRFLELADLQSWDPPEIGMRWTGKELGSEGWIFSFLEDLTSFRISAIIEI